VRMSTDHRGHIVLHSGQCLGPAVHSGVHQHDLVVIARRAVAEEHPAETGDVERNRVRQPIEQLDLLGSQLAPRPRAQSDRESPYFRRGPGQPTRVGIAAYPDRPISQGDQSVERLDRLRPGGNIAGQHDLVRRRHVGLGEHRLQPRKYSVNIRKYGDGVHCVPHQFSVTLVSPGGVGIAAPGHRQVAGQQLQRHDFQHR